MTVEIDIEDLESMIKGTSPSYSAHNNELVKKAGHSYNDQYGRTRWSSLDKLTKEELYQLYLVCKNSRSQQ